MYACLVEQIRKNGAGMGIEEAVDKESREEGEAKLGKLVAVLMASGRSGDAQKAATDKDMRNRLYKEFDIV